MRRPVKGLPEQPQEMITRQAGFAGNPFQVKRQMTVFVDQDPSAAEPTVNVLVRCPSSFLTIDGVWHIFFFKSLKAIVDCYWTDIFLISIRCLGLSPSTSEA